MMQINIKGQQGYCLMGAQSPEMPMICSQAIKSLNKERAWSPKIPCLFCAFETARTNWVWRHMNRVEEKKFTHRKKEICPWMLAEPWLCYYLSPNKFEVYQSKSSWKCGSGTQKISQAAILDNDVTIPWYSNGRLVKNNYYVENLQHSPTSSGHLYILPNK